LWEDVRVKAVVVLITSVIVFFMSKPIGAYQMERAKRRIWRHIRLFRINAYCAFKYSLRLRDSFCGPISFVGIAVPHLVKTFLKTQNRF
jgi:iron complex transport system permease protein